MAACASSKVAQVTSVTLTERGKSVVHPTMSAPSVNDRTNFNPVAKLARADAFVFPLVLAIGFCSDR